MLLTRKEICGLLGVNERTIRKWVTEPGFPISANEPKPGRPTQYDGQAVCHWWLEQKVAQRIGDRGEAMDLQAERSRLTRLQADRIERQEREATGDMLPRKEVALIWKAAIVAMRAKLLAMPSRLTPVLQHQTEAVEVFQTLETHLHEAMRELARGNFELEGPTHEH